MQDPTHSDVLQIRAPQQLTEAIRTAAGRDMTSTSEFVRRILIDELRERGLLDGRNNRAQVGA